MSAFTDRRKQAAPAVEALTPDELHAIAFCVDHMQMKHGFSSIVSRDGGRVGLQKLYEHVAALIAEQVSADIEGSES